MRGGKNNKGPKRKTLQDAVKEDTAKEGVVSGRKPEIQPLTAEPKAVLKTAVVVTKRKSENQCSVMQKVGGSVLCLASFSILFTLITNWSAPLALTCAAFGTLALVMVISFGLGRRARMLAAARAGNDEERGKTAEQTRKAPPAGASQAKSAASQLPTPPAVIPPAQPAQQPAQQPVPEPASAKQEPAQQLPQQPVPPPASTKQEVLEPGAVIPPAQLAQEPIPQLPQQPVPPPASTKQEVPEPGADLARKVAELADGLQQETNARKQLEERVAKGEAAREDLLSQMRKMREVIIVILCELFGMKPAWKNTQSAALRCLADYARPKMAAAVGHKLPEIKKLTQPTAWDQAIWDPETHMKMKTETKLSSTAIWLTQYYDKLRDDLNTDVHTFDKDAIAFAVVKLGTKDKQQLDTRNAFMQLFDFHFQESAQSVVNSYLLTQVQEHPAYAYMEEQEPEASS